MNDMTERNVVAGGLVVAVVFGIAGSSVEEGDPQVTLYAVSSFGWVIATALLAVRRSGRGDRLEAAGFLLLTIAEPLLWVSGRTVDPGYVDAFAGASMGYAAGLGLVALGSAYPAVVRVLSSVAAGAWLLYFLRYVSGTDLTLDDANNVIGYVLLSAAFGGIAVVEYRGTSSDRQPSVRASAGVGS